MRNSIKDYVMRRIHCTPVLADSVYFLRRHWFRFLRAHPINRKFTLPEFQANYRLCAGSTDQCNAGCVFCAHTKTKAARGYMPLDMFARIAEQWKSLGGKEIDFTVSVGEPMLDPLLFDKIELAHGLGLKTSFTTNGTLLERNGNFRRLVSMGVAQIHLSVDVPETYRQSYGVNQADKVWRGVDQLITYNKQFGNGEMSIVLRFRSMLKPSQIIKTPTFQNIVKPRLSKMVKVYFTDDYDNWGGAIKELPAGMTLAPVFPKPNIPCRNLFQPAVEWNGNIRLCACRTVPGSTDLIVGNVKEMSIADAVKSPKGQAIINSFVQGVSPEICKQCTMYCPI